MPTSVQLAHTHTHSGPQMYSYAHSAHSPKCTLNMWMHTHIYMCQHRHINAYMDLIILKQKQPQRLTQIYTYENTKIQPHIKGHTNIWILFQRELGLLMCFLLVPLRESKNHRAPSDDCIEADVEITRMISKRSGVQMLFDLTYTLAHAQNRRHRITGKQRNRNIHSQV